MKKDFDSGKIPYTLEVMREPITSIRAPLVDNYIRIIQSLAKRGRQVYHENLIEPLSRWSPSVPVEPMEKLLSMLEEARARGAKKMPLLYKMSLVKSVAPDRLDLSLPGNISLQFLKSMKDETLVSRSDEALEFVNLLKDGFKVYSDSEFIRMNRKFEETIADAGQIEVEKLIRAHEGSTVHETERDAEARIALDEIRGMVDSGETPEIKRAIIVYLLKYSDPSAPNRHLSAAEVAAPLVKKNPAFFKDIMESTAVIIYHEILKALKENNLLHAVRQIGKFAVLFRGDPATPYFREVDSFEKKFFLIIEQRNLWERLQ